MIEVNSVTKVYESTGRKGWFTKEKNRVVAVDSLSLHLKQGEIIGLLGLNGAGKTTTIKMLSTLLDPTSGSITVDGFDIRRDRRRIQQRINMIAGGERMLYWRLTARENLQYFGRMYGLDETKIQAKAEELLAEVGLNESADTPVERFSKGMKQRLQIARGLINDPDYLFLDEPTLGLDVPIARQLRTTVKKLAVEKGKGILLTSHYLQEVEELCDRVYVIDRGKLLLCDTPSQIVRQAAGYEVLRLEIEGWKPEIQIQFLSLFNLPKDRVDVEASVDGAGSVLAVKTDSADQLIAKALPWLAVQGIQIRQMSTSKPTLEDAIVLLAEGGEQHAQLLADVSG